MIRAEYFHALMPFVRIAHIYWRSIRHDVFEMLRMENMIRKDTRMDADGKGRAKELIDRAAAAAMKALEQKEITEVAVKYGARATDFQKQQFDRQVVAAISIPLSTFERPVLDKLGAFAEENVSLITSVHERYFERIKDRVLAAFESGTRVEDLAREIMDVDDISERDALRIANDQIGKLTAQVNQERQEQIGISGYIWRTMNDGRVRDEHDEREGEFFEWDAPPEDGHPGEAVNCRCYAEPDFSPLLEG